MSHIIVKGWNIIAKFWYFWVTKNKFKWIFHILTKRVCLKIIVIQGKTPEAGVEPHRPAFTRCRNSFDRVDGRRRDVVRKITTRSLRGSHHRGRCLGVHHTTPVVIGEGIGHLTL